MNTEANDLPAEHGADEVVGWYDYTLDADHWFALVDVSPENAAKLLCGFNPNSDDQAEAGRDSTDETEPRDFKRLLQRFEDLRRADARSRSLSEWLRICGEKRLRHHSWAQRYLDAAAANNAAGSDSDRAWFWVDACFHIAEQSALGADGRGHLLAEMDRCIRLPAGEPACLPTIHGTSQLPLSSPDPKYLWVYVRPSAVNVWLQAIGAPYRWAPEQAFREAKESQRAAAAARKHARRPPAPEKTVRGSGKAASALSNMRTSHDAAPPTKAPTQSGPAQAIASTRQKHSERQPASDRQVRGLASFAGLTGWRAVVIPYAASLQRDHRCLTAKELFAAMEKLVGTEESPFEKGIGEHKWKLVVRDLGTPIALKTFQNEWKNVRQAASLL